MTIKKAISRLTWRFGKCKNINPVQDDIDALNEIIETINTLSIKVFVADPLFAKLYIRMLKMTLEHYNTTIYDDLAQKKIINFLEKPLSWHIEDFTDFLNNSEMLKVMDSDSVELKDFKIAHSKFNVDEVTVELTKTIASCLTNFKK